MLPLFVRDPRLAGRSTRDVAGSKASPRRRTRGDGRRARGPVRRSHRGRSPRRRGGGCRSVHVTRRVHAVRPPPRPSRRGPAPGGRMPMAASGTPYAVRPGTVLNGQAVAYQVFTPFARAWRDRDVEPPVERPRGLRWRRMIDSEGLDGDLLKRGRSFGAVGEEAALDRWHRFLDEGIADYRDRRDRPDLAAPVVVGAPQARRDPPADLAGRPPRAWRCGRGCADLRHRARVAGVLRRRPVAPPGVGVGDLRDGLAGMRYDAGRTPKSWFDCLAAGPDRLPGRRCRMRQLLETAGCTTACG